MPICGPSVRACTLTAVALVVSSLFLYLVIELQTQCRLCELVKAGIITLGVLLFGFLAVGLAYWRWRASRALTGDDTYEADETDWPRATVETSDGSVQLLVPPFKDTPAPADMKCSSKCWLGWCALVTIAIVAILITLLAASLMYLKARTLPQTTGTLTLPGLLAAVQVSRDDKYGTIRIEASTEHDLFFAQGVACAQERLWQMEFQVRV